MGEGKIASQAGHAFLGAYLKNKNPDILKEYNKDFPHSPGTKVCLQVPDLETLIKIKYESEKAGLPTFVVVDSGCKNFFNGAQIITALGIGPATKEQVEHITKELKLL
jgi:peptidyl-tRNA hydrolase